MGELSAVVLAPSPYVGPVPFQRSDESKFYGREVEADDLACLVEAHQVVLLYAQSGAGKSSLINAKLIPILETHRNCELLVARPGRSCLQASLPIGEGTNAFIFNILSDWSQNRPEGWNTWLTFAI